MRPPLLAGLLLVLGSGLCAATSRAGGDSAPAAASVSAQPGTGILTLRTPGGESVVLATRGFAGEAKFHPEGTLKWMPVIVPAAEAACASFGLDDGQGGVRFIAALLTRAPGERWKIATEWLAECGPLGEMSFKREKQSFSSPQEGVVLRQARKYKSEGHTFTLDCGCNVCQSATFDYMENETWKWNAATANFERQRFERAYIVQYGEGLMAVARKALGDARLMSRLYRLNPDIKPGGMLREQQQVVFERIDGSPQPGPASTTAPRP